jgi:hypothetical protein
MHDDDEHVFEGFEMGLVDRTEDQIGLVAQKSLLREPS